MTDLSMYIKYSAVTLCVALHFGFSLVQFEATNEMLLKTFSIIFHRIGKIVRRGENADYQHFLLFQQCFQKAFLSGASKVITFR